MNKIICERIARMLDDLHEIGANTSEFEVELDNLCLKIAKFKSLYERNELNR